MIDGKPSRTALMVAAMRAHHNAFAPEPKILRDDVAIKLAGFRDNETLSAVVGRTIEQFEALSDRKTAEEFMKKMTHSVCMRSRLVEGEIEAAKTRGLKQLVVLGAGLDSTAYRDGALTSGLKIFEVDHPTTQAWKREMLAQEGIMTPENLSFAAFDFEHQTLEAALSKGGVDQDLMTVFSWLGVQPYLTEETVRQTLSVLAQFSEGSSVILDFVSPKYAVDKNLNNDGLSELEQIVANMGEPFLSHFTPEDLEKIILDAGFSSVELPSPSDLANRFLGGARDAYAMPDSIRSLAICRTG